MYVCVCMCVGSVWVVCEAFVVFKQVYKYFYVYSLVWLYMCMCVNYIHFCVQCEFMCISCVCV